MVDLAIRTDGLTRQFGAVTALDHLDLEVERGTVVGVLGPNGAGKTTAVRVLSTLLEPSSGRAEVGGYDVATHPAEVRGIIGLTGQYAAVDEHLSGRENLVLFGRLLGLSRRESAARADELLERFALTDAADRFAGKYSGGMRRRLDLGASLIARPEIVFLDEPTAGLDPRSRLQLWDVVRDLVGDGTTVLLTTQYLEEADELADRVVVIDHGRVVARGTPSELKAQIGGQVVAVTLTDEPSVNKAACVLDRVGAEPTVDLALRRVAATVPDAAAAASVVGALGAAAVDIADLEVHSPSLDDVFLSLTGVGEDDLDTAVPAPVAA